MLNKHHKSHWLISVIHFFRFKPDIVFIDLKKKLVTAYIVHCVIVWLKCVVYPEAIRRLQHSFGYLKFKVHVNGMDL